MNRRQFLQSSALLSALATVDELKAAENVAATPAIAAARQSAANFWLGQKVQERQEDNTYKAVAKGTTPVAAAAGPADLVPAFFVCKNDQFLYLDDVYKNHKDLLQAKGDSKVNVVVNNVKPSLSDQKLVANAKAGTLRIDVGQTTPQPDVDTQLAWSVLHALFPQTSSIGDQSTVVTAPNTGQSWKINQSLTIPKGAGFMKWNFFLQPNETTWGHILSIFKSLADFGSDPKAAAILGTAFGFPAIAVTGLSVLDNLLAYLQAKEDKPQDLFKDLQEGQIFYTTVDAKENTNIGAMAIPIVQGNADYIIVAQNQVSNFRKQATADKLTVVNGRVVPIGTDSALAVDEEKNHCKDITVVTATINCQSTSAP